MMQSGLFVPADHGTELAIFDKVFADIGDEQSIEQSLSTFSSHMTNIVEILKQVDERSLVLFDELGAGTDPTEGAALAMAILKRLYSEGIRTIATTHYTELKQFAVITEGVENASVEFDVATLSPTYKLLIGVPGKSNAFEISKRLGLSDDLIDEARHLVHHDDIAFEEIIEGIERNRKEAEEDRNEALSLRLDVERLKKQLEHEKETLSTQRDQVVKKAKDEARSILKRAKDSADEILRSLREMETQAKVDQHHLDRVKSRLKEEMGEVTETVFDREAVNEAPPERVAVGDRVKVLHLGQEGEVLRADEHADEVQVQVGVMKMMVPLNKIEVIGKKKAVAQPTSGRSFGGVSRSARTEIDLRGDDLEEARMRLDKFIDEAALGNLKELRIIHGKGTGTLRKGVQEYVKKHRQIEDFRDGKYNEGGTGVTVVTLKG
jgi:DNA mismatch repair protein MutS2